MADELRTLWDFADLPATEERFRARLDEANSYEERAEVLTQLGRLQALRGDFAAGHELIDQAEALAEPDSTARVRVLLERGRLHRASGSQEDAMPLFIAAFVLASHRGGDEALAVDAAHMAALVDDVEEWTQRGVEIAEKSTDPEVRRWLGPLMNNLGWAYQAAGRHEEALEAFQQALAAREEVPDEPGEVEIARFSVAKTLRALDRPAEAAALMGQSVAWTERVGMPDPHFYEELAEDYAALGWHNEAADQARKAANLLHADEDPQRMERLRELGA